MSMASDKEKRDAALAMRERLESDGMYTIVDLMLAWGQRERDEVEREIVFWALTQSDDQAYYGCMTGDCPHTKREECIQSVQDELRRRRAEADGG